MPNILTVPASGIISFDSRTGTDFNVPNLENSVRIAYDSNGGLNINSYVTGVSGVERFSIDGTQGRLFSVTDILTGTLFSVNNIAGLPILEVKDFNTVIAGKFNTNALVVSGSQVALGLMPYDASRLGVSGNVNVIGNITASGNINASGANFNNRITINQTGVLLSGDAYPSSNPSGFITGVDLSNYVTKTNAEFTNRPTVNGTGVLLSGEGDSNAYPNSNPSGFITGVDTSNFYTKDNPSGFITGKISNNIWIPASALIPKTTSGCGVDSRELLSGNNYDELLFDPGVNEFAQALYVMPNNYNLETVSARFYWTVSTGITGSVVWGLQGVALSNSNELSSSMGTPQIVTDTLLSINQMHISDATPAITIAGTPNNNTPIQFQIYRDAINISDNYSSDARLLGIEILYNQ